MRFAPTRGPAPSSTFQTPIKSAILTEATFEEQLTQFENYLIEQPFVDRERVFFVEASTTDPNADLFVVRSLRERPGSLKSEARLTVIPQDDPEVDAAWRQWYWGQSEPLFAVFNSLGRSEALPSHMLSRMTGHVTSHHKVSLLNGTILPGFQFFRNIVEPHRDTEGLNLSDLGTGLARAWIGLHSTERLRGKLQNLVVAYGLQVGVDWSLLAADDDFQDLLLKWFSDVFRPAAGLKVLRDGKMVGAYILFGPDQMLDPENVRIFLEAHATRLNEVLNHPADLISAAIRTESLRRLSNVMHRVNGPTMRIVTALEDLQKFIGANKEIGEQLVPDEMTAYSRVRDPSLDHETVEKRLGELTFQARLNDISRAVDEIRSLSYQIKRLQWLQGKLPREDLKLGDLIKQIASKFERQLPGLKMNLRFGHDPCLIYANESAITSAIEEVLNNACRELREHRVADPAITIEIQIVRNETRLIITDNALPVDRSLIDNPFEDGSSMYAKQSRGSGLGLKLVRETCLTTGGSCSLFENRDEQGARLPGISFLATFPHYMKPEPSEPNYA
jgi:signal transduction histidine kinase